MKLTIQPFGKVVTVSKGANVRSAITSAGISLRSDCGGIGRCGKCRILAGNGLSDLTPSERKLLSAKERRKGVRLACQASLLESLEVLVPPASVESRITILVEGIPQALNLKPAVGKVTVLNPSERFGKQPSWEALRSEVASTAKTLPSPRLHLLKQLADDRVLSKGPLSLISVAGTCVSLTQEDPGPILGLAADIGSTTIVGYLLDLSSGKRLSHAARKNPQTIYGEDVVSRILYAISEPHGLAKLHDAVVNSLNDIIEETSQKCGTSRERIYEVCAVGNTTMHHLLLGIRPSNLARFPYTPVIRESFVATAKEIGLAVHPEGRLYLPPLVTGFMGSDTVGVVLANRLHRRRSVTLAIDFGTNGEVVLGNRDRLVACSCAAGPAFEGSQIKHGMTGSSGAIDAVSIDDEGHVRIHTIDNYPPLGICGSGLVDAVSEMRKKGIVDGQGRLLGKTEVSHAKLAERLTKLDGQPAFILSYRDAGSRKICLTQRDVRELQLAKSALRAGIRILIKELGVEYQKIEEVFLAGAFGNYVSPDSAVGIGLLPVFDRARIKPVGNAAGIGAQRVLLSVKERAEAEAIARKIEYIELAKHPDFQKEFIEGMAFPDVHSTWRGSGRRLLPHDRPALGRQRKNSP